MTEIATRVRAAVAARLEHIDGGETLTLNLFAESESAGDSTSQVTGSSSGSSNHQLHNAGSFANHRYTLTAHQYSEGGNSSSSQDETFSRTESASGSSTQTTTFGKTHSVGGTGFGSSYQKVTTSNFSSSSETDGESHTTSSGNYSLFQAGSYANEQYSLPCVVQTNNGQHATTFEVQRNSGG